MCVFSTWYPVKNETSSGLGLPQGAKSGSAHLPPAGTCHGNFGMGHMVPFYPQGAPWLIISIHSLEACLVPASSGSPGH